MMTTPPSTDSSDQPQFARTIWLVLGPVLCAVMGLVMVMRMRPNENKLHDFVQEWTSARNWLQGEPVYQDLRRSVADDIRPELVSTLPIQYNAHPPASVLVTLPFGVLPYHQAVVVWNALSVVALALCLWLILGPGGLNFPRWVWWPVASLLLISSPLAHQIYMAQLNLLLLLLYTVAWRLDRSHGYAASAACIAVAASIKIFPGFLFLYFLAQRRYRGLAAGAATILALSALCWAVLGPQVWETYVSVVLPAVAGFRGAWVNASIAGFWAKLLDSSNPVVTPLLVAPQLAKVLTIVSYLTLAEVTTASMWRANNCASRDCAFAAGVVATLLLSPLVWHHYFVILTLPLLILWQRLPATWAVRSLLCAAILLLVINPAWLTGVDVPILGPGDSVIQPSVATPLKTLTGLSFQFYTLLLLWALGCAGCFRLSTISSGVIAADQNPSLGSVPVSQSSPQPIPA